MPIEALSSDQAFDNARHNPNAKYPRPDNGSERLFPFPKPLCRSSFEISTNSKIFTMGSCFAREVDNALTKTGFTVISRGLELATKTLGLTSSDESLYNKYTIHSILNEIRWALDPDHPYPGAAALLEVENGNWMDPQLGGNAFTAPLEEVLRFRKSYYSAMRHIAEADVLVITLGLVEAWFDTASGLYLNVAPPRKLAKQQPGRFQLHVLDYSDIVAALEEIHSLVTAHGKTGVRFLFTVSPVPLNLTFRSQDVLVANSFSKSVQRAALERFVLSNPDVDYFPSYEFVALGDPNFNWVSDYRHVNPAVVNRIMSNVMQEYTTNALQPGTAAEASEKIHALYKSAAYIELIKLSKFIDLTAIDVLALYRIGLTHKKLGSPSDAYRLFSLCVERDPNSPAVLENAIRMAVTLARREAAHALIRQHENLCPDAIEFRSEQLSRLPANTSG